jgi:F-type H+-transporting ATPase subunit c
MKRLLGNLSVMLGFAMVGASAFAQEVAQHAAPVAGNSAGGLVGIGAGLAIGLAAFGATQGQGRTTASAVEGIARNPGSSKQVFLPFILGLVFMELQALLGFVIAFMLFGKV